MSRSRTHTNAIPRCAAQRSRARPAALGVRHWAKSLVVCLAAGLLGASAVDTRAETPLQLEFPFDRVTLDAQNDNTVLRVIPLDLPNRQLPAHPNPKDMLSLRLVEQPGTVYEVPWGSVVKVELFEEMLFARAEALVAQGQFDEAAACYRRLEEEYPRMPALAASMQAALLAEAQAADRRGDRNGALALLLELHRRNPRYANLEATTAAVADALMTNYRTAGDPAAARIILGTLANAYPRNPLVDSWRQRMQGEAAARLAEARQAAADGRWAEADDQMRQLWRLWPTLPGAEDMARTVHRRFPRVAVGVVDGVAPRTTSVWVGQALRANWLVDGCLRRQTRLLTRRLTETAGFDANGGTKFAFPLGAVTSEHNGAWLRWQPTAAARWSDGRPLSAVEWLRATATMMNKPGGPALGWPFSAALETDGAAIWEMDAASAASLGWLDLAPPPAPSGAGLGPFVVGQRAATSQSFLIQASDIASLAGAPCVVDEINYADRHAALAALRAGRVQAVDRLGPDQLEQARGDRTLHVDRYALPLVHLLIPNRQRPLAANATFRRALLMALDRAELLRSLSPEVASPKDQVLAGMLPLGESNRDPWRRYAVPGLAPRPYAPELAAVLAQMGAGEARGVSTAPSSVATAPATDAAKEPSPAQTLTVVLAHNGDEVARRACELIQAQWRRIGVETQLRLIEGPAPAQIPADVDFWFVEMAPWRPAVDLSLVLAGEGMTRECSPLMQRQLRQMNAAPTLNEMQASAREVQRLIYDETAVLPLWQCYAYFAYRADLEGVGGNVVEIYQNIEAWRPAFRWPRSEGTGP